MGAVCGMLKGGQVTLMLKGGQVTLMLKGGQVTLMLKGGQVTLMLKGGQVTLVTVLHGHGGVKHLKWKVVFFSRFSARFILGSNAIILYYAVI